MRPVEVSHRNSTEPLYECRLTAQGSHRLNHPSADANNAPGDATAGTWVRVAQAWAGANWGGAFIPRVGQEDKDKFPTGNWNAELAGLNAALKEAQAGG